MKIKINIQKDKDLLNFQNNQNLLRYLYQNSRIFDIILCINIILNMPKAKGKTATKKSVVIQRGQAQSQKQTINIRMEIPKQEGNHKEKKKILLKSHLHIFNLLLLLDLHILEVV